MEKLKENYKKNSGKITDHASIIGAGITKTDTEDSYVTYYPFYKYQFDLLQNFLFGTKGYASTKVAARGMIITTYDILKQEIQHNKLFDVVTGWQITKEAQPQPPVRRRQPLQRTTAAVSQHPHSDVVDRHQQHDDHLWGERALLSPPAPMSPAPAWSARRRQKRTPPRAGRRRQVVTRKSNQGA